MKNQKTLTILTFIPVLAIAVMIFLFSSQNAADSNRSSGYIVEVVLNIVSPEHDALSETHQKEQLEKINHFVRKTAHFLEYAMLGFFLLLHISVKLLGSNHKLPFILALSAGVGSLYAVTDELHQLLISGRSGQITDVAIDSLGVAAGIILLLLIIRLSGKYSVLYNPDQNT